MENISVKWANEAQSILLITLENREWTVDDMVEALRHASSLVEAIDHPYVTIADNRLSGGYVPRGLISSFPRIINEAKQMDHDLGTIVVVERGMNQVASDIFSRAIRKIAISNDFDAAMQQAEQRIVNVL